MAGYHWGIRPGIEKILPAGSAFIVGASYSSADRHLLERESYSIVTILPLTIAV